MGKVKEKWKFILKNIPKTLIRYFANLQYIMNLKIFIV